MNDLIEGSSYRVRWLDEETYFELIFMRTERGFWVFKDKKGKQFVARFHTVEVIDGWG